MKIKILVYDAKTNGLPKNYKRAEEDLNNYPNVIELACNLIEIDTENLFEYKLIYSYNTLVKPIRNEKAIQYDDKNCKIPKTLFELAHKGDSIESVAFLFQGLNNSANFVVCHNFFFNRNVMASELLNLGIELSYRKNVKLFCTMKYSTDLLHIKGKYDGEYKYPSLAELFKYLTEEDLTNYFNPLKAKDCVDVTTICLLNLIKQDNKLKQWLEGKIDKVY